MYHKKIDEFDFEGVIVKPVRGVYKCPYCHGISDPINPVKSGMTMSRFQIHMKYCENKPSSVAIRKQKADRMRIEADEKAKQQEIFDADAKKTSPVKIGDTVHVCDYYVTKPCYEQRGSRIVKVRYEEERQYFGRSFIVQDIKASDGGGSILLLFNNKWYHISSLKDSLEDAKREAGERQSGYDSACREASLYR